MSIVVIHPGQGDTFAAESEDRELWGEWLRECLGPIAWYDVLPDRITCGLAPHRDMHRSR